MTRIREAVPADAERLVELLSYGTSRPGKEDTSALEPYLVALAEIDRCPHNRILVAEREQVVIGLCQVFAVRHLQERGGLCAEIESMHVDPDERGRGIGRGLLDVAVQVARDWGCYRVQLTSNKVRADAHRFYERAGFVATHAGLKLVLR